MKIGIYTPYLNTYGGGEKYICKIAEILSKEHDVEFIVFEKPDIKQLQNRLNVNLSDVSFNYLKVPNLSSRAPYFRVLIRGYAVSNITKSYDLFINQENNTLIPSYAKKSIYICQLPTRKLKASSLLKVSSRFLPIDIPLDTYDKILTYSYYNKRYIEKWWNKKEIEVLYPPVDVEQFHPTSKENIILSVGRFFVGGHNKKQLEMIRAFKQLYDENETLNDWEYHLVGGVSTNTEAQEYLKKCQKEAKGYPIYFHVNVPFGVLKELYARCKIYWHATGLNGDENKHPERMEHFGITTVEAMAAGCAPIVINKGGQPEIVRNMIDGFLWNSTEELKKYTLELINDETLWKKMSTSAIKRSQKFGITKFKKRVKQAFGGY